MNCPYNKSHTGSHVIQEWMDKYFGTDPNDCEEECSTDFLTESTQTLPQIIDVYITSFGNNFFIEYQIKTLRKFLATPFNIVVIDNNIDESISIDLQELCEDDGVNYIKAPYNIYQEKEHFDPSLKLGCTLNWIFYNIIKKRKPEYFMFLDHDCMLFRDFDPREWLDAKGLYGTVCRNLPYWNIHVTQFGAKYDYLKDLPVDFRPSYKYSLDTAGAMYGVLYSQLRMEDFMLSHTGHRFFKEDTVSGIKPQHYEIIDNCWVHLCSSTHDKLAGEGQRKLDYFKGFLDRCLLI